ncbi:MAG: hypothetical protein GY943_38875, partial [Chloroflexi bacterium]|nr:hypothetical protein [Chloroflexota bacterium]
MSGIYGYALTDRHSESLLPIMRQGLAETAVTYEQWVSATKNVGLASEKPAQLKNATQTMQYSQQDVICFVDGVVYPDKSSTAPELADPHPAKTLLQQYLNSGIDCLRRINGSFVVAWWHQQEKKLIIATDKIGYRQLYYTHQPTGLFFSTYLARLPAMLTGTPEINEAAFAELLAYRNILGEQTLIKNINLLPTGSALIYEAGRANCYKYWRHDEIVPYGRYDNNRLDELADIFKLAVKRSFQPNRNSLLALTGGIDSRAILAASANQNLSYSTLTDGSPYGSDAMLARSAAHHVNVPHFSQPVYPHVLGDLLVLMVAYQSGIVSTIHSHPCHYLQSPLPFDNVISGILGGPVRSHWMKPKDLEHPTAQHAMRVILKAVASPTAKKIDVAPLWQSQYAELAKHGPQQHLNEIISEYAYPDTPLIATDY